MNCPRCENVIHEVPAGDENVLRCSACGHEVDTATETLPPGYLGALGLFLYPIIYSPKPSNDVDRVVSHFVDQQKWGPNKIQWAIAEIESELEKPTREMSTLIPLKFDLSEETVRVFLKQVAIKLKNRLGNTGNR